MKPLKIVINSGNGAAGPTLDLINKKLKENGIKTNFVFVHHNPDPSFPNGIPNPMLEENRSSTADIVINEKADFGVAFDGDFDRCFLFDHYGNFIPGEYMVGLLAKVFLSKEKGATIIHDPRVVWNTIDVLEKCGGQGVTSKTGHAFVKAAMRKTMRFMEAKCRPITISGIFLIATVGLYHGSWFGSICRHLISHYQA